MTMIRKHLLIALSVLAIGSAGAQAQAQAPDARPAAAKMNKEQWQAKRAERAAAHQQKLREQLKLTRAQDAAFATYLASRQPMARGQKIDRDAWKTMSAPARMELRLQRSKARLAAMETRLAAMKSFYAVLTPEQQKVFDENSGHGGWGHGGHRGHRGHGMGHKGGATMQG